MNLLLPISLALCGGSTDKVADAVRSLLAAEPPTSTQVAIFGSFLLAILLAVVAVEVLRRRRDQLAKAKARWQNFATIARQMGLDDSDIERMQQMHAGMDSLHAPDAMLRIPAVYDRALDAWLRLHANKLSDKQWSALALVRRKLKFRDLSAETSLSHTRQISEGQELRLATEDGNWTGAALVATNDDARMVVVSKVGLPKDGRLRVAFSRQGDGEYKTYLPVLATKAEASEIVLGHTDQLVRQQLRMWVRVPVLLPGSMWRVIGPDGLPHPLERFDVTLLDLSGGGAMVNSSHAMEVESRGMLDFNLGETRMEGVHFVMLRSGKASRHGSHVCHLCFENIDVQTQERIMRYVFERQRAGRVG